MKNIFKKGLVLGGLLAVATAVGLTMTDEGQQLTRDLKKDLKTLSKNLRRHLWHLQDITKENFDNLVEKIVEDYAAKKKLALQSKKLLLKTLKEKWYEMEKIYKKEEEENEEK